ncbi:MAG: hypothetical protein ACR2JW_10150 [Thermomicrobiales bacterium]
MISTPLTREDETMLREAVHKHRPEYMGLVDMLSQKPMPLAQRSRLDQALLCELQLNGHHREDAPVARLEVWHLNLCILRRCILDKRHLDLLRTLVSKYDTSLLPLLDTIDQAQWSEEQRQQLAQHVRHEYRDMAGVEERRVLSAFGNRLWELRRYVYTSTPLHNDDYALLRETVQKWDPGSIALVNILEAQPPQYEERTKIYDAITAEMQETGIVGRTTNQRGIDLDRLIDYIGYLTRSNKPGGW